jgi:hypothetical protein
MTLLSGGSKYIVAEVVWLPWSVGSGARSWFVGGLRSGGDDDLAADLARLELADRVGDLGEGVRPFDAGCHVSGSGELRETI